MHRCPSDLLRFYPMAPSKKLASRLEVGERGTRAFRRTD